MRWEQVKTIFIIVFFMVNLFLLVTMMVNQDSSVVISDAALGDLVTILKSGGVDIDKSVIPTRRELARQLDVTNRYDSPDTLLKTLIDGDSFRLIDITIESTSSTASGFSVTAKPSNAAYFNADTTASQIAALFRDKAPSLLSKNQDDKYTRYVYCDIVDGKSIFDSYLLIDITADSEITITGVNWNFDNVVPGAAVYVSNIGEVAADFPRHAAYKPETISKINLGYYLGERQSGISTVTAIPAWEIVTDKAVYYFDGHNSDLLSVKTF